MAQATIEQLTLAMAFDFVSSLPTPEATIRETEETRAAMVQDKRDSAWLAASRLYGILTLGYSATQGDITVKHVVSMTGYHLYWEVKTPNGVKVIHSKLELLCYLPECGAQLLGTCDVLAPSSEGATMALDTDDLVKDVDPDDTSDLELDESAEAVAD